MANPMKLAMALASVRRKESVKPSTDAPPSITVPSLISEDKMSTSVASAQRGGRSDKLIDADAVLDVDGILNNAEFIGRYYT